MQIDENIIESFWLRVNKLDDNSCWLWIGKLDSGYGYFSIGKGFHSKIIYAHRLSYQLHTGKEQGELCVCHSCNNKACVNPKHLYLATNGKNIEDAWRDGLNPIKTKSTTEVKTKVFSLRQEGFMCLDIAKKLEISPSTVSRILNKKVH